MRLQQGFFDRSSDTAILPPLTRDESRLLTPYHTADLILRAWVTRDWNALLDFTLESGDAARLTEQNALDAFDASPVLAGYELSPGSVSYDGKTAVLTG